MAFLNNSNNNYQNNNNSVNNSSYNNYSNNKKNDQDVFETYNQFFGKDQHIQNTNNSSYYSKDDEIKELKE